ncbi:hypothetical protein ZWY2020_030045 [Hordeum vulgare]|nr:hypothetical protein ZWY2020_030045 [Hordeum vulgare]
MTQTPGPGGRLYRHWNRLISSPPRPAPRSASRHYASLLAAGLRLTRAASTFPSLAKSCAALRLPRLSRSSTHTRSSPAPPAGDIVFASLAARLRKCARPPRRAACSTEMPTTSRTVVSWNCGSPRTWASRLAEAVSAFNAMRGWGESPPEHARRRALWVLFGLHGRF